MYGNLCFFFLGTLGCSHGFTSEGVGPPLFLPSDSSLGLGPETLMIGLPTFVDYTHFFMGSAHILPFPLIV